VQLQLVIFVETCLKAICTLRRP